MYRKISILFIHAGAILVPGLVWAQSPEEAVDLGRITQRSVRKLVLKENVTTATDFQHIATSCYQPEDSVRYQVHLKTIIVKAPIGTGL